MFKLAGLFVEIKAMDDPLKASIEALKSKAGAMANALGSSISGAFAGALGAIGKAVGAVKGLYTAIKDGADDEDVAGEAAASLGEKMVAAFSVAPGPIGIAAAAATALFGLIDGGSEDLAALGGYFTEAMAPVKDVLNGVAQSVRAWVKSFSEAGESSKTMKAIVEQLGIYATAAFENIRIAIDQGVAVFIQFKSVGEDLFQEAQIWFEGFQADLQATFGGPGVSKISEWGAAIQSYAIDKAELLGIFIRNWPDFFEIARLKIVEVMSNIGEYMQTVPENAKIIGEYIANNWVQLFVDAGSAIGTAFMNLGENLKNIWQAFLDYIHTGKFEVNFKPLLDGFVATAGKIPDLVKPVLTDLGDQIKAIEERVGARTFEGHAAKEAGTKKAAEKAAEEAGGKDKFKSETTGAADFAARLRAGIFNQGSDDTPKQSLEALRKIAVATEKLEAKMALNDYFARLA